MNEEGSLGSLFRFGGLLSHKLILLLPPLQIIVPPYRGVFGRKDN